MTPTLLYILFVCSGDIRPCEMPHGLAPTLTRQECLEEMWMIRSMDHSKRVVCRTKERIDVIDSSGELRAEWQQT